MKMNNNDGLPRWNSDLAETRSLQFIAGCIILTATLFLLIDTVTDLTEPIVGSLHGIKLPADDLKRATEKVIPILP